MNATVTFLYIVVILAMVVGFTIHYMTNDIVSYIKTADVEELKDRLENIEVGAYIISSFAAGIAFIYIF